MTCKEDADRGKETKRPYRVEFSLTGEEFELLEAAAGRAGLARGAYAAEAALAAARGGPVAADRHCGSSWAS